MEFTKPTDFLWCIVAVLFIVIILNECKRSNTEMTNKTWTTHNGKEIEINRMSARYIDNILNMLTELKDKQELSALQKFNKDYLNIDFDLQNVLDAIENFIDIFECELKVRDADKDNWNAGLKSLKRSIK